MNSQSVTLYIDGMHCASCAARIQSALERVDAVLDASVSYSKGTALVHYDGSRITVQALCKVIQEAGYSASMQPFRKSPFAILWPIAAILALFALLEHFGILNLLVPSQLSDSSMGYGALFLTGLLTSVHCIAMCGGISLSQNLSGLRESASPGSSTVLYNLGRLLSYTIIGALLGTLGMLLEGVSLGISYTLQGTVKLIAGCAMVFMGLNMLDFLPRFRTLHRRLPYFKRPLSPFGFGLLNGLMPCGPLQSMQLLALASGSPWSGGLSMAAFALGTMPLMLCFGSLVGLLGQKYTKNVLLGGSILVCVLGLGMVSQGGALAGLFTARQLFCATLGLFTALLLCQWRKTGLCSPLLPLGAACLLAFAIASARLPGTAQTAVRAAVSEDGYQTLGTELQSGAYPDIQVQAGIPVRWIVQASPEEINGCNNRILCRSLGLEYSFQPGENVIEFTPREPGSYQYSCWMGMISGTITVTQ